LDLNNGREVSYAEAKAESEAVAWAVKELGVDDCGVLALMLPNCAEYPCLLTGTTLAGGASTTVNPIYGGGEVSRQLEASGASAVVTTKAAAAGVLPEAFKRIGKSVPIVAVDAEEDYMESGERVLSLRKLLSQHRSKPVMARKAEFDWAVERAVLPYSSGTTGPPKGVELTHKNLVFNMEQLCKSKELDFMPLATDDFFATTICLLPMFHIFAMNVITLPLFHMGHRIVFAPGFEPDAFVKALEDFKVNDLCGQY